MSNIRRKWSIISEHVARDDAGDPYYVAAGVRGVETLEEWTEVVPASDLRGAVDENAELRRALTEIRDSCEPDDPIYTAAATVLCRPAVRGQ
jgi:hypothetical protein